MEENESDGWVEAVSHILEAAKANGEAKSVMRQLGSMVGNYYQGLLDAEVTVEEGHRLAFEFVYLFHRMKKDGLI